MDVKNHTCRYNPVAFQPLQPRMDSCEIYKSGVESERPVLTTRNPAEVISIPKRFIGAWRLSDPSGVTIFGWHLAKKLNLAVPPLTGIPFLQWLTSTYKHVSMWITHTYIKKHWKNPTKADFHPRARPLTTTISPSHVCCGFHYYTGDTWAYHIKKPLMSAAVLGNNGERYSNGSKQHAWDSQIHKGNAPTRQAGSWKECICQHSAHCCVCADRNNGIKVQASCSWRLNLRSISTCGWFNNACYSFPWLFFSYFDLKKP